MTWATLGIGMWLLVETGPLDVLFGAVTEVLSLSVDRSELPTPRFITTR